MRFLKPFLALLLLIHVPIAAGQTFKPGAGPSDQNPPPMKAMCWNGSAYQACATTPTTVTPSNVTTVTDGSGAVTTGGTSQQVFPANSARIFLFCQNPVAAIEPLFLNFGASASTTTGTSVELAAGGTVFFASTVVPGTTITITAATAGHKFICKQG